ncbi:hypothetical protein CYMTET_4597 [Cymbomonas tetramitiformis]|uniref:Reverse transcriptase domain-containing protein n=1 Tax=Cymbomonas tetramitiformis TaxID=36881 RepID=A0AAE0H0V6_9CHLO|nr:hypothetical protein CYMTET_4597 [Cymbomonas tetramitiformis]
MQWITYGVKMRWRHGPPPPFNHGVSLMDATRQHSAANMARCGEGEAASKQSVDESNVEIARIASVFGAKTGFDLQDGFHAVEIHPDFQRFMQFDLQGELFQCSAMPFGWSDAPRVFSKFVRVMVEALRSPQAAEDRKEIRKLRDGSVVRQQWSVRRRAGGASNYANHHSGMRVLPYMVDFLVLVDSQREGFLRREKVQLVLHRLGLRRNEKKGQWDPVQVVEHLGLEVDLKLGQFRYALQQVDNAGGACVV